MKRRSLVLAASLVGCSTHDEVGLPLPEAEPLPGVTAGERVERGMVAAIAPPPGEEVFVEAILDDGSTQTLYLRTDEHGVVGEILEHELVHDDGGELRAGPCGTKAHTLLGHRWTKPFEWFYNAASTPAYLEVDAVVAALRRANTNVTHAENTCGLADRVGFTIEYRGTRDTPTNIVSGGCGGADGVNVTGFGDLAAGVLAVACTWSRNGIARESDVRINKVDHRWYARLGGGCTNRFGIEAVMTHERIHTAGLGHTSAPGQTMNPSIAPCTDAAATLGSGDVAGLRRLY